MAKEFKGTANPDIVCLWLQAEQLFLQNTPSQKTSRPITHHSQTRLHSPVTWILVNSLFRAESIHEAGTQSIT